MTVWGFELLFWPFLHMVFDFIYFWIFGWFLQPKAKWVLISNFFQNLGFLPHFACYLIFSSFLGTMWVVDLDDLLGYLLNNCCTLCCIGIHVASILLSLFWFSDFMFLCSHPILVLDLYDSGAPHTSMWTYICWVTCGAQSSMVLLEVMIIGGWVGNLHAYGHSSLDEHG